MATIRIESNLKTLGKDLEKVFNKFPKQMDFSIGGAGRRSQVLLFRKTPKDTGTMARGWFTKRIRQFFWEVNNMVKHTDAVEFGTGLFSTRGPRKRISAKPGKRLKFPVRNKQYRLPKTDFGGGPEFFIPKSVKGQKPQFIVKNSESLANRILSQEVLKGLKRISSAINKLKPRTKPL